MYTCVLCFAEFNSQLAQANPAGITAVCYLGPAFGMYIKYTYLRMYVWRMCITIITTVYLRILTDFRDIATYVGKGYWNGSIKLL